MNQSDLNGPNSQANQWYQKTRNRGRWKKRVSKEERKYLDKVDITFAFNALYQLKWPH